MYDYLGNLDELSLDELKAKTEAAVAHARERLLQYQAAERQQLRNEAADEIESIAQMMGGDADLLKLAAAIRGGSAPLPDGPGGEDAPSEEEPEAEREADEAPLPASPPDANEAVITAAVLSVVPATTWERDRDEIESLLHARTDEVEELLESAQANAELKWKLTQYAAEMRLLKERNPDAFDESLLHDMRMYFGRMTRICQETLNPRGLFVDGLRESDDFDWEELHDDAAFEAQEIQKERKLAERQAQREAERKAEAVQQLHQVKMALANLDIVGISGLCTRVADYLMVGQASDVADLLEPYAEHFTGSDFRSLRRHWRKSNESKESGSQEEADEEEADDTSSGRQPNPVTEACRDSLLGQRALMIGGTRRPEREEKIRELLGLSQLIWLENEKNKYLPSSKLVGKIQSGQYDIVLLLRDFCGHHIEERAKPVCRSLNIPFVVVDRGYGLVQICLGLQAASVIPQTT